MIEALANPYTGAMLGLARAPVRAHDADVAVWSGRLSPLGVRSGPLVVGGAGWTDAEARGACLGEALERFDTAPRPGDGIVASTYRDWDRPEPAIDPRSWVGFSEEQLALPEFPFRVMEAGSQVEWVAFRRVPQGDVRWVPVELAYLEAGPGRPHRYFPGLSTGLVAGPRHGPLLLRGLQEVIERDAVVGAWWGAYPLFELDPAEVFADLGHDASRRLRRPNLVWRFFRIDSPWSRHGTLALLRGEDLHGECVSVGSACRETMVASLAKASLEAVQGRGYVRMLATSLGGHELEPPLVDFPSHAVYYSLHPEALARTPFATAVTGEGLERDSVEPLDALIGVLGPERPVLFRDMTPVSLAPMLGDLAVLRVVVPGLQPLYGDDRLAPLGGPMGARLGRAGLASLPPHPFP